MIVSTLLSDETVTVRVQTEELMKEVQVLKEELSGRDETIARLTLQCQQLQQQQSVSGCGSKSSEVGTFKCVLQYKCRNLKDCVYWYL